MVMGIGLFEYEKQYYPQLIPLNTERQRQAILTYRKEIREWTLEQLTEAEGRFIREYGRLPEPHEFREENGLPRYAVFCKIAADRLKQQMIYTFLDALRIQDAPADAETMDESESWSMGMELN